MSGTTIETGSKIGIYGLGLTGQSVAKFLNGKGFALHLFDDSPTESALAMAKRFHSKIYSCHDDSDCEVYLKGLQAIFPTPGLPDDHIALKFARDNHLLIHGEFDIAQMYDERSCIAVTGTNGKTTVTMMINQMLNLSGIKTKAVGNTDTPLVEAIQDESLAKFIVEASSFRLGQSQNFAPDIGVWLNFSPDHLDVHKDLESYELAKAKIWANLSNDQVALANEDDAIVMSHRPSKGRFRTFGLDKGNSKVSNNCLFVEGRKLMKVEELPRRAPHDISNALAAALAATHAGADDEAIIETLRHFSHLPHRIEMISENEGVRWYDDSKSTTPHSVTAALESFENVILIMGGRNKGLDLTSVVPMLNRVKHLIAIGEASKEIELAFRGRVSVSLAESMQDAVGIAHTLSDSGDVVLLSPGCASFDWYKSYKERGLDFAIKVNKLHKEKKNVNN
tara:strand:+ start:1354 stop:2706 length:1353 start_codon:yes stop_codon:yes gene_type:complete